MSKNLFSPNIISIKIFSAGPVKVTPQQLAELLAPIGTLVDMTATSMVFDGTALVPAPADTVTITPPPSTAPTAPITKAATGTKGGKKAAAKVASPKQPKEKAADEAPKTITFTPGSDPEKIWHLIRSGTALTSTQIREKLSLGSNIVNTTVYRLKNAGMIRPMSYNAPNGDTLYTSTEWDPTPVEGQPARQPVEDVSAADLLEGIDDEVL